jgi:hypothetical protein
LFSTLALLFLAPLAVSADSEADLSDVSFHGEVAGPAGDELLRMGVAALWDVMGPLAADYGFIKFPKSDFYAFLDQENAARHAGLDPSNYDSHGGWAFPSKAYAVLYATPTLPLDPTWVPLVIPHEAAHLVQVALSDGDWGSRCIAEGAASWYADKAVVSLNGENFDRRIDFTRDVLSASFLDVDPDEDPKSRPPLFVFSDLESGAQWDKAFSENPEFAYGSCTLYFDMLIKTGGGEEAYFVYLNAMKTSNWERAFDQSFNEPLEVFQARMDRMLETYFEDFSLPHPPPLETYRLFDSGLYFGVQ